MRYTLITLLSLLLLSCSAPKGDLPRGDRQVCEKFRKAGGKVVFAGSCPEYVDGVEGVNATHTKRTRPEKKPEYNEKGKGDLNV